LRKFLSWLFDTMAKLQNRRRGTTNDMNSTEFFYSLARFSTEDYME
jgi:hypothetical protein